VLTAGSASQDKRARKFIKRRLGTLRRAKGKMEFLTNVIAEQRRAGHA
jgi:large subunit ribosomal protein L36e